MLASRSSRIARRAFLRLAGSALAALGAPPLVAARPREVVKVGSTLALPPFEFVDGEGRPRGFEIDLLQAIGDRLDLAWEFVKTPFSQAFLALAAGKYRLNASTIFIRCERITGPGRVGRFTVPTFDVGLSIATRAGGAERTRSMEGLAGLVVGVESRGTGADLLADRYRETVGFTKVVFDSTASLFLALEQGRIDAAIQSEPVSRYALRARRDLVVGAPLAGTEVPVGLLGREGDPLLPRLDETIDVLKRTGVTAALHERWFGAPPRPSSLVVAVVPPIGPETCQSAAARARTTRDPR